MQAKSLLGIDVGASGIKGAIVDLETGEFIGKRFRVPMPEPSTPENAARLDDSYPAPRHRT